MGRDPAYGSPDGRDYMVARIAVFFASKSSGVMSPASRSAASSRSFSSVVLGAAHRRRRRGAASGRGGPGGRGGVGSLVLLDFVGVERLERRGDAAGHLVLDVLLGEEHRLLERRGVVEHHVVVGGLLGRRQDLEVAPVEHPPEDALLEDRVVDLLEAAVGGPLVEQPFDLEDAPVRDRVVLGPPTQVDPDDVDGAHHEQRQRQPAEQVTGRPADVGDEDRQQEGDRDPHHQDPPLRAGDPAERVLPRPVQDVLSLHEQRVGVARHPSSLPDRGPQARGCARAYTSRTRSPVRCV